jgi:prolyl-tRNA editing enzyme YbaK/EbsC (Cys-tRNA(Pro) deacylase)
MSSVLLISPSVERVRAALGAAGFEARIVELPGAARTAAAAAAFLGCEIGQIANSLVFRAAESDAPLLVMSSGARRVDLGRLGELIGEPIEKADAGFVRRHTGFAIGGVPPVGHGVRTLVEKSLSLYKPLWAAAGHPHTVFPLTYAELLRITAGTEIEVAQ